MLDIKEYLKQTKTVLLTQDAFDELMQRAYAQPERTEERTETHACDLISRQAAIDTLTDMHCKSDEDGYVWIIRSDAWARIDALPSVQPEKRTETHSCDCISRHAAIAEIARWIGYIDEDMIGRIQTGLKRLPSAQPEPQRTGRWRHYEGCLTCSECGIEYYDDIMEYCGDDVPRFCPNCGARMEDNNESD